MPYNLITLGNYMGSGVETQVARLVASAFHQAVLQAPVPLSWVSVSQASFSKQNSFSVSSGADLLSNRFSLSFSSC